MPRKLPDKLYTPFFIVTTSETKGSWAEFDHFPGQVLAALHVQKAAYRRLHGGTTAPSLVLAKARYAEAQDLKTNRAEPRLGQWLVPILIEPFLWCPKNKVFFSLGRHVESDRFLEIFGTSSWIMMAMSTETVAELQWSVM